MKWSDGEPFTATDCVYYYNYILVTDMDNERRGFSRIWGHSEALKGTIHLTKRIKTM